MIIEDLREKFIISYVWPLVKCGLLYEGRYLLGTSLARPCISEGLISTAKKENAKIISHGATGKGNDQIRFELSCYTLYPEVEVFIFLFDYYIYQLFFLFLYSGIIKSLKC